LALGIRGTVVNYFSAALVAGALWLGTGPHRSWVNIRVLAFYGYISYGLYLVHGWIFELYDNVVSNLAPQLVPGVNFGNICIRFVVVLAVSTAVAYVSRITYEEYFLRMKQKAPQAQKSEEAAAVA
jgi:peptidoglycan/LPS O-acetylase OafA/YrhL